MDRNDFLKLCQAASKHEKKKFPDKLTVIHDGIKYIPFAYNMGFDNGVPVHSAILLDMNANALVHANMEKVVKLGDANNDKA